METIKVKYQAAMQALKTLHESLSILSSMSLQQDSVMKILRLLVLSCSSFLYAQQEYDRYTLPRGQDQSDIVYYLSHVQAQPYSLIVLSEGSYCNGQPIKSPS